MLIMPRQRESQGQAGGRPPPRHAERRAVPGLRPSRPPRARPEGGRQKRGQARDTPRAKGRDRKREEVGGRGPQRPQKKGGRPPHPRREEAGRGAPPPRLPSRNGTQARGREEKERKQE